VKLFAGLFIFRMTGNGESWGGVSNLQKSASNANRTTPFRQNNRTISAHKNQ
jgi:hypothetical protein